MQVSFSDVEYDYEKKVIRRDRFLAKIEAVTPWARLVEAMEEYYPTSGRRGRPPIGLERMLRLCVFEFVNIRERVVALITESWG